MAARRVTLNDVARLAQVSAQTVSRVVRDDGAVSPSTKERISQAIETLGYYPNLAGRMLAQNRSGMIRILNTLPMLHGHLSTFVSMVSAAEENGYQVSVGLLDVPSKALRVMVDAVIVLSGSNDFDSMIGRIAERVPTVVVESRGGETDDFSTISVDHFRGGQLAAQHLIDQEVEYPWHFSGPHGWRASENRKAGFLQICAENGVAAQVLQCPSWESEAGYEIMMAQKGSLDGVFVANDMVALGVLKALNEREKNIPSDVKVVGFDDVAESSFFVPSLSTVRQDFKKLGRGAVKLVTDLLNGEPNRHEIIEPELIVRASTAKKGK